MNSNWSYSPETPNLGQIQHFLEPCDLEIWWLTLKNNRAPILSNITLYASFHHHMWIQTGVTVRKPLSWVLTSVTLTFDLWPWPFEWTSLLSLVITSENFVMIRWWEHSQKGVTDRQTDGQTERSVLRAAWSQLKRCYTEFFLSEQKIGNIFQSFYVWNLKMFFEKVTCSLQPCFFQILKYVKCVFTVNPLDAQYYDSHRCFRS